MSSLYCHVFSFFTEVEVVQFVGLDIQFCGIMVFVVVLLIVESGHSVYVMRVERVVVV